MSYHNKTMEERQTETKRETDRETDRDRDSDRQIERQRHRDIHTYRLRGTEKETESGGREREGRGRQKTDI